MSERGTLEYALECTAGLITVPYMVRADDFNAFVELLTDGHSCCSFEAGGKLFSHCKKCQLELIQRAHSLFVRQQRYRNY